MLKDKLLAVFIILWIVDSLATILFVSNFGIAAEANPLMRGVLEHGGFGAFIMVKTVVLIPLVWLHKHIVPWVYLILVIIMIPVASAGLHMAFN